MELQLISNDTKHSINWESAIVCATVRDYWDRRNIKAIQIQNNTTPRPGTVAYNQLQSGIQCQAQLDTHNSPNID